LKDQDCFSTDFLHLTLDSGDLEDDGPVLLLRDLVNDHARDHGLTYVDAARQRSQMRGYEGRFGASWHEEDGHMVEIFTYPSDTVMSLLAIVNAIEKGGRLAGLRFAIASFKYVIVVCQRAFAVVVLGENFGEDFGEDLGKIWGRFR
jgi:hypothetical protein